MSFDPAKIKAGDVLTDIQAAVDYATEHGLRLVATSSAGGFVFELFEPRQPLHRGEREAVR